MKSFMNNTKKLIERMIKKQSYSTIQGNEHGETPCNKMGKIN